ncbi:MAG: O-antigen ligase family protein [Elusimicrobia bacterium]|nr:O-antigen ligase family protein [Elusimicrobiota bacterium]
MTTIFLVISSLAVFPFFSDSFWGAKYFLTLLLLPLLFFGGGKKTFFYDLKAAEIGFLIVIASIFFENAEFFQFFRFLAPFCLYLYISRKEKDTAIKKNVIRLSALISSLALIQQVTKFNLFNAPLPYATFGNPMYMGAWLAAALPFSADTLLSPNSSATKSPISNRFYYESAFAFAAGFTVLLLTRSQSAYMGFGVALIYMLLRRKKISKAIIILTGGAALSALMYFAFFKVGDSSSSSSFKRRINYYKTSFEMIKENPLIGMGAGNYRGNYVPYRLKAGLPYHPSPRWAHCDILHFLCELGFFRTTLIFLFVLPVLFKKTPPELAPYKAGITALIFTSLTAFPFQRISTIYLFFIFAGIIVRDNSLNSVFSLRNCGNGKDEKYIAVKKAIGSVLALTAFIYAFVFAYSQMNWKRGEKLLESGKPSEAAVAFEKAAKGLPSDHRIWLDLGRAKYRSGDIGGSLSAYRRCLSVYFDWDICYNTAIAFKAGGNKVMAEKFMRDFQMVKYR